MDNILGKENRLLRRVQESRVQATLSHCSHHHLDFGFSSRFVAHLWSLCIHVHIRFVLYLATEHLGPGFQAGL